jgi:acyl transferase domain-containing protein
MKPDSESLLAKSEYAQPLCTVIQVALVNILKTWGVQPAAVIGHSSGEIAAAYAAGAITAAEAITIAYYRGRGTTDVHRPGGMAAVGLGRDDVAPFLQEGVVIACDNSPQSVTLSGDEDVLGRVMADVKDAKPDVFLRRLHVEMAYHSRAYSPSPVTLGPLQLTLFSDHMRGIGKAYESSLDALVDAREVAVPFYSSVAGNLERRKGALGAAYWRKNLESPVLFYSAVMAYLRSATTDALFVEIGPQ